jgi:hypothetical protein
MNNTNEPVVESAGEMDTPVIADRGDSGSIARPTGRQWFLLVCPWHQFHISVPSFGFALVRVGHRS